MRDGRVLSAQLSEGSGRQQGRWDSVNVDAHFDWHLISNSRFY